MTTDKLNEAVERLEADLGTWPLCDESDAIGRSPPVIAADLRQALSALRIQGERETVLRAALEPFARWAERGSSREYINSNAPDHGICAAISFTAGDYRRARAALTPKPASKGENTKEMGHE